MVDWTGVDKAVRSEGFPYNIVHHHSKLRKTEKTRCYILALINDYNKLSD